MVVNGKHRCQRIGLRMFPDGVHVHDVPFPEWRVFLEVICVCVIAAAVTHSSLWGNAGFGLHYEFISDLQTWFYLFKPVEIKFRFTNRLITQKWIFGLIYSPSFHSTLDFVSSVKHKRKMSEEHPHYSWMRTEAVSSKMTKTIKIIQTTHMTTSQVFWSHCYQNTET